MKKIDESRPELKAMLLAVADHIIESSKVKGLCVAFEISSFEGPELGFKALYWPDDSSDKSASIESVHLVVVGSYVRKSVVESYTMAEKAEEFGDPDLIEESSEYFIGTEIPLGLAAEEAS